MFTSTVSGDRHTTVWPERRAWYLLRLHNKYGHAMHRGGCLELSLVGR